MTTETISAPPVAETTTPLAMDQAAEPSRSETAFEWQRFWIRLQQTAWSSLAIIPVDAGIDVHSVVTHLVTAGRQADTQGVSALAAVGLPASRAQEIIQACETAHTSGQRVVVACDPLAENPATLAISRAVSGVLLVARLGESRISTAKRAVDAIGRERVIASITLERAR